MLTKNINFKNFDSKKINKNIKEDLKKLLKEKKCDTRFSVNQL